MSGIETLCLIKIDTVIIVFLFKALMKSNLWQTNNLGLLSKIGATDLKHSSNFFFQKNDLLLRGRKIEMTFLKILENYRKSNNFTR